MTNKTWFITVFFGNADYFIDSIRPSNAALFGAKMIVFFVMTVTFLIPPVCGSRTHRFTLKMAAFMAGLSSPGPNGFFSNLATMD